MAISEKALKNHEELFPKSQINISNNRYGIGRIF